MCRHSTPLRRVELSKETNREADSPSGTCVLASVRRGRSWWYRSVIRLERWAAVVPLVMSEEMSRLHSVSGNDDVAVAHDNFKCFSVCAING